MTRFVSGLACASTNVAALCLAVFWLVGCSEKVAQVPEHFAPRPGAETASAQRTEAVQFANSEDWPGFLGPRGDGTSLETGVSSANWTPHPPVLWTRPIGVSYGAPSIVGDSVYHFGRHAASERLSCFSAFDGKELWHWEYVVNYEDAYGYDNGPRCSPIVDGDRIYLYGVSGHLSCVSAAEHKPLWTKDLKADYGVVSNFFGVASNPIVYGDLLLVMVGGSPEESQSLLPSQLSQVKPNNSAIVAFNKITGEVVYEVGDDLASYSSPVVRRVGGRDIGLALLRNGLLAWEPTTGKQLSWFSWRADMLESVNAALPVTDGNRILISEAYDVGSVLLEYQPEEPAVIWKDAKPSLKANSFRAHWSTPILIDGYLYGCNGRNQPDCDFRCVEFATGKVMWKTWGHERSSVVLVDGHLIALGELGTLKLIRPTPEKADVLKSADLYEAKHPDAITGQRVSLGAPPCWAAPVVSGGKLYIRSKSQLTCFELIPRLY